MKERLISLVVFCALGLAACFFSYKYGPIPVLKQSKAETAPPGWVPPATPPNVVPPTTPPAPVPPVPKTPQPKMQPG